MEIRLFHPQDAEQVALLFHETIHEINRRDYSGSQVKAWAPDNLYFRDWAKVCATRFTYVADKAGLILGFGELEVNGHIDCFYCHKDYQGQGIGKQIYQTIERQAIALQLNRLFVEASITAQPFFKKLGFSVIKAQQVSCRGETFMNYAMEKFL
jgi:putative acetyltransferase